MRDSPLPESLSAFQAVVLAHAKTGVRSGSAHVPRQARLQSPLRTLLPPKPESGPHDSSHRADPIRAEAISRPFKSHRQITASLAPETYFKRPNRYCPAETTTLRPASSVGLSRFGSNVFRGVILAVEFSNRLCRVRHRQDSTAPATSKQRPASLTIPIAVRCRCLDSSTMDVFFD